MWREQSFGEGTVLGMEDRNVLALMVAGAWLGGVAPIGMGGWAGYEMSGVEEIDFRVLRIFQLQKSDLLPNLIHNYI
jgi:hypothetical protein